jgi:aldehyde:ferredoxin oxidoreductase
MAITGKADKPVYIYIEDGRVEIRDASHLWGKDTQATQELIRSELNDPDIQIACIGQAGENQVVSAVILHDIQNASGQGGVGAVMGSKNLKAIAVRGTGGLKIADPEALQELWNYLWDNLTTGRGRFWGREVNKYQAGSHCDYGTDHKFLAKWGYGTEAPFAEPPPKNKTIAAFTEKHSVGNLGCAFCPLQCQQNYSVAELGNSGVGCYTNLVSRWFAKTYDTNIWWKSIVLINRYGINVGEVFSIQSWLMLLYEKGIITAEDTDGIPMEWGSEEACLAVIEKVALQEGFGKHFKGGAIPAADHIGGEDALNLAFVDRNIMFPLDYFVERGAFIGGVGGTQLLRAATQYFAIEPSSDRLAMYQPVAKALGISGEEALELLDEWFSEFSIKHTGHKDAWRAEAVEGKAKYLAANENSIISSDISGKCDWSTTRLVGAGFIWDTEDTAKAVSAATGEECSLERMLDVVQKKRIMEISYNILCEMMIGEFPVVSDTTTSIFTEPTKGGEFDGCEWDEEGTDIVGEEYCHIRGCDPETGVPTRKELERLGLKYVADKLEEQGLDVGSENTVDLREENIPKRHSSQIG